MTKKKFSIDLNNYPKWGEINWIDLEITNSIYALEKLIEVQDEALHQVEDDLLRKIKNTERSNGNLDEMTLDMYVEHLHGIEQRIVLEFERIQDSSQITTIFSIFESKLKLVCDNISSEFQFNPEPKKTNSIIHKHWQFLNSFLDDDIRPLEKHFTPIYNRNVLRNIIVHQNSIADTKQYNELKNFNGISFYEGIDSYHIYEISKTFIRELLALVKLFFELLIKILTQKTNQLWTMKKE